MMPTILRYVYWIAILGILQWLPGCAYLADRPAELEVKSLNQIESELHRVPVISANWWTSLKDPQLNELVEKALRGSPSIANTEARITMAKAMLEQSNSALTPQVALTGQANRQQLSQNYLLPPGFLDPFQNYGFVAGTFGWSLDIWGKQKKLLDGAKYRFVGSENQLALAKLNLEIAICSAYVELDHAILMEKLSLRIEQIRGQLQKIAIERARYGTADAISVERAKIDFENARSHHANLDGVIRKYQHELAALVGEGPSYGEKLHAPQLQIDDVTRDFPKYIPSDLIARRPDLQGLLNEINATKEDVGAAKLEYLPSFDLQANVGYQAFGLDNLFRSGSQIFSVGPVLNLPIFNGGRLDANLSAKEATRDQAIAQYHQQLLEALRESADGISNFKASQSVWNSYIESAKSAETIFHADQSRLTAGVISHEELGLTEISLATQIQGEADARLTLLHAHIALIQALGGGFHSAKDSDLTRSKN